MRVRVYHAYYDCDTGCCGHIVEVDDKEKFEFEHPYGEEDHARWARELAEKVIRRWWPECLDSIDWNTLEIDIQDNDC